MVAEPMRRRIAGMPPCHADGGDHAAGSGPRPLVRLRFPAEAETVRQSLARVTAKLAGAGVGHDERTTAELVLAEAMNNIVEHAYDAAHGNIRLDIDISACGLQVTLRDNGIAMPLGALPPGNLPDHGTTMGTLPEGGFGWFLIHTLARDLRYDRTQAGNRLRFWLAGSEDDCGCPDNLR